MISVSVPASTANLGAGFDTLGLALGLRNRVRLVRGGKGVRYSVRGFGADRVLQDPGSNLFDRAFRATPRVPGAGPSRRCRSRWTTGSRGPAASARARRPRSPGSSRPPRWHAGRCRTRTSSSGPSPSKGTRTTWSRPSWGGFTVSLLEGSRVHHVRLAAPPPDRGRPDPRPGGRDPGCAPRSPETGLLRGCGPEPQSLGALGGRGRGRPAGSAPARVRGPAARTGPGPAGAGPRGRFAGRASGRVPGPAS